MLSSVNLLVLKGIFIFIFIINIFLLNCLCVTFSSSSLGFFSTPKLYLGNLCVFVISSGGSAVSLLHPLIVPCDPSPSVFLTCDMIFFFFFFTTNNQKFMFWKQWEFFSARTVNALVKEMQVNVVFKLWLCLMYKYKIYVFLSAFNVISKWRGEKTLLDVKLFSSILYFYTN